MKVTVNVPVAHQMGCYLPNGSEYEIDDKEADLLINAGQANAVDKSYKPKPAAEPVTLDAKPSTPVEAVTGVVAPPAATNNALTTDAVAVKQVAAAPVAAPAAAPTAVEIAKANAAKGGK